MRGGYLWGWDPCFSRSFNDWEVDVVDNFLVWFHRKRVCEDLEDTVLWTKTKSGSFLSNSLQCLRVGRLHFFPFKKHLELMDAT